MPSARQLKFSRSDFALALLSALSIAVLLLPQNLLSLYSDLPIETYKVELHSDAFSGGASRAQWLEQDNRRWQCQMIEQVSNPYCSILYTAINDKGVGIDMDQYQAIKLKIDYEGDGSHLRVYLRNRNPAYYVLGDTSSTKYNSIELPVADLREGVTISLSDFRVAEWWLVSRNISPKNSHVELNDVVFIEVQTGSQSRSGHHTIEVKSISLEGTLFSQETLYKALISLWIAGIVLMLVIKIYRMKRELERNLNYQTQLTSINKVLNLQNKQFEDLAKTDQLTGLLNRIGIRDALLDGLNDWKAQRTPFSFVLIDLDHFKSINDQYGHDVGDLILQEASALMQENSRTSDLIARWGGEELILVCPNTDLSQATVVAELMRKRLAEARFSKDLSVTASFGVASLSEPDLDSLFKRADEALYEAKRQGRNQVVAKS